MSLNHILLLINHNYQKFKLNLLNIRHIGSLFVILIYFLFAIILIRASVYYSEQRSFETLTVQKQTIHEYLNKNEEKLVEETTTEEEKSPFATAIFSNNEVLNNTDIRLEMLPMTCETIPGECATRFLSAQLSTLKVAPKHKMLLCPVPGNLASFLKKTMCFLFDEENYDVTNKTLTDDVIDEDLCKLRNNFETFKDFEIFYPNITNSDWTFLTIIRDPMERFLARFVEHCIKNNNECNGCQGNMTCFLIKQHSKIINFNIEDFVKGSEEAIFLPQTWNCNFQKGFEKINYSNKNMEERNVSTVLFDFLENRNVSTPTLEKIQSKFQVPDGNSDAHIYEFLENRLLQNTFLLNLFIRCYYWDFVVLNYPFPIENNENEIL